MVKRQFEIFKNGKIISKPTLEIKTEWEDITLKQFVAYMAIVAKQKAFQKRVDNDEVELSEKEIEITQDSLLVDMLMVLTGLPQQILYSMNIKGIEELYKELNFTQSSLPSGVINEFWFRSATKKKIDIWEKDYQKQSMVWNFKKKTKTMAEIKLMKKSHFTIGSSIDELEFKQYVASQSILKRIRLIKEELKHEEFAHYPELIALLVRKNGKVLNLKEVKQLAIVFEDLPFTTAYKIVNFFLSVQSVLSRSTQMYLTDLMQMRNQAQKQKLKGS